jgi:hypothetical protein
MSKRKLHSGSVVREIWEVRCAWTTFESPFVGQIEGLMPFTICVSVLWIAPLNDSARCNDHKKTVRSGSQDKAQ